MSEPSEKWKIRGPLLAVLACVIQYTTKLWIDMLLSKMPLYTSNLISEQALMFL